MSFLFAYVDQHFYVRFCITTYSIQICNERMKNVHLFKDLPKVR